jgi:hypothetical protein
MKASMTLCVYVCQDEMVRGVKKGFVILECCVNKKRTLELAKGFKSPFLTNPNSITKEVTSDNTYKDNINITQEGDIDSTQGGGIEGLHLSSICRTESI